MPQSKKHLNQESITKANKIINELKKDKKLINYDLMVKEANKIIIELNTGKKENE